MGNTILRGNVVLILDDQKIIINRGSDHGVKVGDKFFIYQQGYEVTNPADSQSLGEIEWIKAQVEAVNVQEKMTLVMGLPKQRQSTQSNLLSYTLTQPTSGLTSQAEQDRERLNVMQNQISGSTQIRPIAIGDPVRSVHPVVDKETS